MFRGCKERSHGFGLMCQGVERVSKEHWELQEETMKYHQVLEECQTARIAQIEGWGVFSFVGTGEVFAGTMDPSYPFWQPAYVPFGFYAGWFFGHTGTWIH